MPGERRHVSHGGQGHHEHGSHGSTSSKAKRPSSSGKRRLISKESKDKIVENKDDTNSVSSFKIEEEEKKDATPEVQNQETEQNIDKTEEVPNTADVDHQHNENEVDNDVRYNDTVPNGSDNVGEKEKWAEKSSEDDGFNIRSFNDNILEFTEIFDSDKYRNVDEDYPVDDLINIVSQISVSIQEFKRQTQNSQQQLEGLRTKMKQVKENIHFSVSRKAFEIKTDDDFQSVEERELTEKLARLNAEIAKANSDLSDALRLSTETESTAVKAQLAAERAKEEAKRIEEELVLRTQEEQRRKKEAAKQMEEIKRKQEEEERKQEEERKAKEAEWKRREAGVDKVAPWEKWQPTELQLSDGNGLGCIIRGNPNTFDKSAVTCQEVSQLDIQLPYGPQEELVGNIIQLSSRAEQTNPQHAIYVAIPFTLPRSSAHSREAFVKAEVDGEWNELPSKEVTFETHKDLRFVQVEMRAFLTVAVMTRLKRDYVTFSRRSAKLTSSYDQRITLSIPRETFRGKEHLLLQVQPVDSGTVHELQTKNPSCKHLLTSSPIMQMQWQCTEFNNPITLTLPCPPNPAKARKIAQMRKLKEEKMKNPQKVIPVPLDVREKEENQPKQKKAKPPKKTLQEQLAEINAPAQEEEKVKQTKWYMGDYAHSDDDEHDELYLVAKIGNGKWFVEPEVKISQVKLDVLQFSLYKPLERFMVLRVRTNTDEDYLPNMSTAISDLLMQRFVQVVIKQRSDYPFDTRLDVVPTSKVSKTVKQMQDDGFEEGPEPSQIVSVNEGDNIEVNFRGNICNSSGDKTLRCVYNSNVTSFVDFSVAEVDKYLQRNHSVYRGVVEIYRTFLVYPDKKNLQRKESILDENSFCVRAEKKKVHLCDIPLTIPKDHVEPSPIPVQAPVIIHNDSDPVNDDMMRHLAAEMGDEWRKVANSLSISRARIQAILRNIQMTDSTDEDAKYQMLMTWLKKMPKSIDKVSVLGSALTRNGRPDLAEDLRIKHKNFKQQQLSSY